MEAGRVSDFSIERILSPRLGPRPPPPPPPPASPPHHRGTPGPDSANPGRPAPVQVQVQVQVPVPAWQRCGGTRAAGQPCPFCAAGFHPPHLYPGPGVYAHFSPSCAGAQPLGPYSGYPQAAAGPTQPLHKVRMRTVFTDSQIRELEALFKITKYPTVQARAEVATRAGLSEENVRVWFKNRRARKKRH